MNSDDSFFSRWSRRKTQVRGGATLDEEPVRRSAPAAPTVAVPEVQEPVASAEEQALPAPPPPTLEDAQGLTPDSDFRRFVAPDVAPEVRNAAVKKLFADPHFNVMDGLDIYIDDYSKPSPLSAADMARMVSAQFLKLVDEPQEPAESGAGAVSATENDHDTRAPDAAEPEETPHDDADLQLQPDHAPGPSGPGTGSA